MASAWRARRRRDAWTVPPEEPDEWFLDLASIRRTIDASMDAVSQAVGQAVAAYLAPPTWYQQVLAQAVVGGMSVSFGGVSVARNSSDPTLYAGRGEIDPHSIVYGLRNWNIDNLFRLVGKTFKTYVWTPGENRAVCLRGGGTGLSTTLVAGLGEPDHSMDNCGSSSGGGHGFYAYYDGSRDFHTSGDVTGIIKGWGEGVVGDKGFRVMSAEIVAIMFDDNTAPQVRDRVQRIYPDVPVFTSIDLMLAEFPLSADDLEFVPEADDDFWTRDA